MTKGYKPVKKGLKINFEGVEWICTRVYHEGTAEFKNPKGSVRTIYPAVAGIGPFRETLRKAGYDTFRSGFGG